MNARIKLPMITAMVLTLTFSSCKKDDNDGGSGSPAPTKKEMLSGNNWQVSAYSVEPAIDIDQNGTQENNLMPYLQACNLDDFTDMNIDFSYTSEEGASKCDPNSPQVYESGNWALNSDESVVVFTPAGGTIYEFNIVSLSSSVWEAEQIQVSQGVTYTFSITFD